MMEQPQPTSSNLYKEVFDFLEVLKGRAMLDRKLVSYYAYESQGCVIVVMQARTKFGLNEAIWHVKKDTHLATFFKVVENRYKTLLTAECPDGDVLY